MEDKRDECGCHRECRMDFHECDRPCVWPNCLTDDEHAELLREVEKELGGFLAEAVECPECGLGVLTKFGTPVTGCEQHSGG